MTMTRALAWKTALAALILLAVGACQEPQDPPSSTGAEPSSTVSADPSTEPVTEPASTDPSLSPPEVSAPEVPPMMAEDSVDGAAYAALYLLQSWNYMAASGDTTGFASIAGDDCEWCQQWITEFEALHASGGWIDGPGFVFDISTARVELPTADDPRYIVRFDTVLEPYDVVEGDGTRTPGTSYTFSPIAIAVLYENGSLRVTGVNYAVA